MNRATRNVVVLGGAFTALDLFRNGETGFWFDFSKTDRTWQESTGQTIADDDSEVVGLALEQWGGKTYAERLASQPTIISNGDFATGDLTGWNNGCTGTATITVSGGGARFLGTDGSNRALMTKSFATVVGRVYRMSWTRTVASGSLTIRVGTSSGGSEYGAVLDSALGVHFVATATTSWTTWLTNNGGGDITVDDVEVKELGGAARQATSGNRPQRKTGGLLRFDGTNDSLLTGRVPSSAGSIFAKVAVPASVSATRAIIGGSIGASACFLAVNSSGIACAGIGGHSETTIKGGADLRSTTAIIGVTWNGTTVALYVNGAVAYSAAQSGTVGSDPLRLGATNNGGTAADFWPSDIYQAITRNSVLTPAEVQNLTNYWTP